METPETIHPRVASIIDSCKTHLQLETCAQWAEHIYTGKALDEVMQLIDLRRKRLDITYIKVHTMD
jgi:hypothetical protein